MGLNLAANFDTVGWCYFDWGREGAVMSANLK